MSVEIERKFLLTVPFPKRGIWWGESISQGMLSSKPVVRVRVTNRQGDRYGLFKGYLTVKGPQEGISRPEWEYEIPYGDAQELLKLCPSIIEKTRYRCDAGPTGFDRWEIDVFEGANVGLVVAEIEMSAEDEAFERPDWLGEEVTHDPRYLNVNLAQRPFTTW